MHKPNVLESFESGGASNQAGLSLVGRWTRVPWQQHKIPLLRFSIARSCRKTVTATFLSLLLPLPKSATIIRKLITAGNNVIRQHIQQHLPTAVFIVQPSIQLLLLEVSRLFEWTRASVGHEPGGPSSRLEHDRVIPCAISRNPAGFVHIDPAPASPFPLPSS